MKMNKKFVQSLTLILCVAVFVVLTCLNINGSIWFDESYTAYIIRGDFDEIWRMTAIDVHPPLYYFFLKAWSLIFGNSVVGLRTMSVFFGAIAVILAFCLVKKLFGAKTAGIATLAMSVSPLLLRYAAEMRMYTMVLAVVLAASVILVEAIRREKTGWWIGYGALVSLGMWTHYFTALIWIAQLAYLIYIYRNKIWQKNIILAYMVAILLWLPWLPCFVKQFMDVEGGFWISAISLVTPVDYLSESLFFVSASAANGWLMIVMLVLLLIGGYYGTKWAKQEQKESIFLIMMVFLPPILLILLSLPPMTPLFVSRYVTYSAVMLWMLMGVILAKMEGKKVNKVLLAVVILICGMVGGYNVARRPEPSDVRGLIAAIAEKSDGEIVAATESIYLDAIVYSNDENPVYGVDEFYQYGWGSLVPIREYRYQVVNKIDELPRTESFWWLADKGGIAIPDGYVVVEQIEGTGNVALKLQKSS